MKVSKAILNTPFDSWVTSESLQCLGESLSLSDKKLMYGSLQSSSQVDAYSWGVSGLCWRVSWKTHPLFPVELLSRMDSWLSWTRGRWWGRIFFVLPQLPLSTVPGKGLVGKMGRFYDSAPRVAPGSGNAEGGPAHRFLQCVVLVTRCQLPQDIFLSYCLQGQ